jgi:hypothetical protein
MNEETNDQNDDSKFTVDSLDYSNSVKATPYA